MTDCYVVTRRNSAFHVVEAPSLCARVNGALTTKVTTYRLDVLGRRETMRRQRPSIQGRFGQPWTPLDSAPRSPTPQGADAFPVPPARES
jgi:hypothetical protein